MFLQAIKGIISRIIGGGGGVSGTILVHDTFTGADGTAADSRAPDIGPTPVVLRDGANGGVWQINDNNELERTNASTWSYLTYDTVDEYDVEISASVQPQINGVQGSTYIVARFQDHNNWVGIGFFDGTLSIVERIAGVGNTRATKAYTFSTAQTYFVKMVVNGSTCELWVNGVKELETTGLTTLITNSGKHGVRCWYDFSANKVYDNLLITSGTPSSLLHGLVSWWTLDEVSGTRSDSHGTNTLADNNTVGSTTGVFGNAADFVKANSESLSVAAGHNLESGARDFSFALHYTPTTLTDFDGVVHCGTGSLATQSDYLLTVVGGKLRFYIPYGGVWYWADSTVTLSLGTTYHVYCQYDNTTKNMGISVNHETLVETTGNTPTQYGGGFYLGHYFGYQYGDCKIDEPAFWARKLTTAERLEHQAKTYSDLTAASTGAVVSIEVVEISPLNSTSHTINLTKGQDATKCVPFMSARQNGDFGGGINGVYCMFDVEVIDNAGTPALRVTRQNSANSFTGYIYVVEFNADIAVQQIAFSGYPSATASCTAVDLSKSFLLAYSEIATTADFRNDLMLEAKFNSTTQVAVSRQGTVSGTLSGHVFIVEDTSGNHFDVQTIESTYTTAGNQDETITSVDLSKSMLLYSFSTDARNRLYSDQPESYLLDSTTVRTYQEAADSINYVGYVVTWKDGTTVQHVDDSARVTGTANAATTISKTISTIDPTKTIAFCTLAAPRMWTHRTNNDTSWSPSEMTYITKITDATTLDLIYWESTPFTRTVWGRFEVVQFAFQSESFLLDTVSGAFTAYSVRKLRSAQTNAIRVRRASDSSEQDIGFVGENLDTASLETFCSGTDGFIVTWYDQSGNGNDATQSTAANQPQIVSGGTTIVEAGVPTLQFDGGDYLSQAVDSISISLDPRTWSAVCKQTTSNQDEGIFTFQPSVGTEDWNAQDAMVFQSRNSSNNRQWYVAQHQPITGYLIGPTGGTVGPMAHAHYMEICSSGSGEVWKDNVSAATDTGGNASTNTKRMLVGVRWQTGSVYLPNAFTGNIQEIIFWGADKSADRTTISDDVSAYFSTP